MVPKVIVRFIGFMVPKVVVSDINPKFIRIFLDRVMEDKGDNTSYDFNVSSTNRWSNRNSY